MEERLYKKLESYGRSDFYPFHMPGHKRNPLAVDGDFPVERDITEINGFDNLHHAEDLLKRAQEELNALNTLHANRCLRLWVREARS